MKIDLPSILTNEELFDKQDDGRIKPVQTDIIVHSMVIRHIILKRLRQEHVDIIHLASRFRNTLSVIEWLTQPYLDNYRIKAHTILRMLRLLGFELKIEITDFGYIKPLKQDYEFKFQQKNDKKLREKLDEGFNERFHSGTTGDETSFDDGHFAGVRQRTGGYFKGNRKVRWYSNRRTTDEGDNGVSESNEETTKIRSRAEDDEGDDNDAEI